MLDIDNYHQATSLDEAYSLLTSVPGSAILGGCGFLRLGQRKITTAIDLGRLALDYVREEEGEISIGAMTSLRTLETHPLLKNRYRGLLARSVAGIVGVQLRNLVTIGGTVAGRYAFSDPLSALLALDARVRLHQAGLMGLADYLAGGGKKDIVVELRLTVEDCPASFFSVRRSATDYPVLNVAAAVLTENCRLVVGARPGRAALASEAMAHLQANGLTPGSCLAAGLIAAQTLQFGDNPRASGRYRQAICPVLVKRALLEVCHAA